MRQQLGVAGSARTVPVAGEAVGFEGVERVGLEVELVVVLLEAEFLAKAAAEEAVEFVEQQFQLPASRPDWQQLGANPRPASPGASRTGCPQRRAFVPWPC